MINEIYSQLEYEDPLMQPVNWVNPTDTVSVMRMKLELPILKEEHTIFHALVVSDGHAMDELHTESEFIKTEDWVGEDPLSLDNEDSGSANAVKSSNDNIRSKSTTFQVLNSNWKTNKSKSFAIIKPVSDNECKPEKCGNVCVTGCGTHAMQLLTEYGERKFKCDECGKCFTRRTHLKSHLLIHSGVRNHKCDQCGKCFTLRQTLARHLLIHSAEKNYKCNICGKCFTLPQTLATHFQIHSGDRNYKCVECEKCFTQRAQLTAHLHTHAAERNNKCEECGKCFMRRSQLTAHLHTHSGERSHKCDECGKCFTQRGSLSRHLKFHTGERKHKCVECGNTFILRWQLTAHLQTHSSEKIK